MVKSPPSAYASVYCSLSDWFEGAVNEDFEIPNNLFCVPEHVEKGIIFYNNSPVQLNCL